MLIEALGACAPEHEYAPSPTPDKLHNKATQLLREFGRKTPLETGEDLWTLFVPVSYSLIDKHPSTIIYLTGTFREDFSLRAGPVHLIVLEDIYDINEPNHVSVALPEIPEGKKTKPYRVSEDVEIFKRFGETKVMQEVDGIYGGRYRKDIPEQGLGKLDSLLDYVGSFAKQEASIKTP